MSNGGKGGGDGDAGSVTYFSYKPEFMTEVCAEARQLGGLTPSGHPEEESRLNLIVRRISTRLDSQMSSKGPDQVRWEITSLENRLTKLLERVERERKDAEQLELALIALEDDLAGEMHQQQRRPGLLTVALSGFFLAFLLGVALVPTLTPLLFHDDATGFPIPNASLYAFLSGLAIGIAVVVPSFYAAIYHVPSLLVRHGSLFAGMLMGFGASALRYFQVGGLNAAVVALTIFELGVVLFIEVVAEVLRGRFKDARSVASLGAKVDAKKRQVDLARIHVEEAENAAQTAERRVADLKAWQELMVTLKDTRVRETWLRNAEQEVLHAFEMGQASGQATGSAESDGARA